MYLLACAALTLVALAVNRADTRMLALTLVVGASIFIPSPDLYDQFYLFCLASESAVALIALVLRARASALVAACCAALILSHIVGYYADGSAPFSPYQVIVKLLEFAQIAACAALSPRFAPILRNRRNAPNQ